MTMSMTLIEWPFSRTNSVSQYQNDSILDFTGIKDDGGGGDNWSYKNCKAPVRSSLPTNQNTTSYRSHHSMLFKKLCIRLQPHG